jgi:hypothetical protein
VVVGAVLVVVSVLVVPGVVVDVVVVPAAYADAAPSAATRKPTMRNQTPRRIGLVCRTVPGFGEAGPEGLLAQRTVSSR